MPSMLRSPAPLRALLALFMALSPSCCKRPPTRDPVRPTTEILRSCLTPELLAARPPPIVETLVTCSSQGNSPEDCVAHDDRVREAYIERLVANCEAGAR